MAAHWEIAAHSAYNLFLVKYLIVNLVFFYFGFWSGNFFRIPGHCLLGPF